MRVGNSEVLEVEAKEGVLEAVEVSVVLEEVAKGIDRPAMESGLLGVELLDPQVVEWIVSWNCEHLASGYTMLVVLGA